jgi:hypothetical protein
MLYSEAFRRMGVPNVVRGSPWAAINTDGVLCVMGHFDYFDRNGNRWYYEHPAQPVSAPGPRPRSSVHHQRVLRAR